MLKTSCTGCVFKSNPAGCEIEKATFCEEKVQFTKGFCRHKRNEKWVELTVGVDKSTSCDELLPMINQEELNLTAIILCTPSCINKLEPTITNIKSKKNFINEVIIVGKLAGEEVEQTINFLNKELKVKWVIENLKEPVDDEDALIDYTSRLVTNHWFVTLSAGESFTENEIQTVFASLSEAHAKNTLCFYYSEKDKNRIFANVFAFREMQGNLGKPWFEKIKESEDWKELCMKIALE